MRCVSDGEGEQRSEGAGGSTQMGGAGGVSAQETGGATQMGGTGGQSAGTAGGESDSGGAAGTGGTSSEPEGLADRLSETGLYADIVSKTVAARMRPFRPQFELWSDGASKARWIDLPDEAIIDTTDMDDWTFPVGTRLFKEFVLDGKRLETRIILRVGTGSDDFLYGTYVWNEDETEATLTLGGVINARGTHFDVPSEAACRNCHGGGLLGGLPSRVLGFSAVQLSHEASETTLTTLLEESLLSHPPTAAVVAPGNEPERAALGYLHANCGFCHNDSPDRVTTVDLLLRLLSTDVTVADTGAYQTAVNHEVTLFTGQGCSHRIAGQDTQQSCLSQRMASREQGTQMPPIGTKLPDPAGLLAIDAWIGTLPPPP